MKWHLAIIFIMALSLTQIGFADPEDTVLNGLVAFYKLNDTNIENGMMKDLSNNSHHLNISGTISYVADGWDRGLSARFQGNDNNYFYGLGNETHPFLPEVTGTGPEFSVLWCGTVRNASTGSNFDGTTVFWSTGWNSKQGAFEFVNGQDANGEFWRPIPNTAKDPDIGADCGTLMIVGSHNCVGATHTGTTISCFENGTHLANTTGLTLQSNGTLLLLGRRTHHASSATQPFFGDLDIVVIWDRVVSGEEMNYILGNQTHGYRDITENQTPGAPPPPPTTGYVATYDENDLEIIAFDGLGGGIVQLINLLSVITFTLVAGFALNRVIRR